MFLGTFPFGYAVRAVGVGHYLKLLIIFYQFI